jgi:hypothetical protein
MMKNRSKNFKAFLLKSKEENSVVTSNQVTSRAKPHELEAMNKEMSKLIQIAPKKLSL